MRVAIYGRVSTGHQVEHQTIEQQLERLAGHVRARAAEGWALDPAHVFRDDGHSGAALARPGLDRLRDAVRGREVDRVNGGEKAGQEGGAKVGHRSRGWSMRKGPFGTDFGIGRPAEIRTCA